jgi:dolichol-phosphate mannosyltransferase
MRRLVVLLPCLNEAEALPALLARLAALRGGLLPGTALEALVVDDGSTDATPDLARQADAAGQGGLPVHLVQHPRNLGLGAALLSGIQWFAAHCAGGDCLAAMDADGTHPPELLRDMLARLDGGAEVVIASRYAPGGSEHGLSARRKLYSHGASWLLGLAARVPGVRDYSCGYRLYSHAVLARGLARYGPALVSERSFVCMAELLCKLGAVRARIVEAPLELHYELKAGASKMNVPVTIRRYVALVGRLLFTRDFRRE